MQVVVDEVLLLEQRVLVRRSEHLRRLLGDDAARRLAGAHAAHERLHIPALARLALGVRDGRWLLRRCRAARKCRGRRR